MEKIRRQLIEKLGGYPDIDSAIESIKGKNFKDRYTILTLAVTKLFNTIGADDILRIDPETGQWVFKGKFMNEGDKTLLIAEATQLLHSKLWAVLKADIEYQANKKMFRESQTPEDLTAGKFWLFTLDAIKTRLKSMQAESGLFNSK